MQKLNFIVKLLLPFVTLALLSGCQNDPYAGTAALEEQPLPFDMPILENADRSKYSYRQVDDKLTYIWDFEFDKPIQELIPITQENINQAGLRLGRTDVNEHSFTAILYTNNNHEYVLMMGSGSVFKYEAKVNPEVSGITIFIRNPPSTLKKPKSYEQ